MMVTPFSVTTTWSATEPSTLPPCAAAMSTMTEPRFISATSAAVIRRGAARPGMSAVVMTMSTSAACAEYSAAAARSYASLVALAYPSEETSFSSSGTSTGRYSPPIDLT